MQKMNNKRIHLKSFSSYMSKKPFRTLALGHAQGSFSSANSSHQILWAFEFFLLISEMKKNTKDCCCSFSIKGYRKYHQSTSDSLVLQIDCRREFRAKCKWQNVGFS
jgi:hypothetical protein